MKRPYVDRFGATTRRRDPRRPVAEVSDVAKLMKLSGWLSMSEDGRIFFNNEYEITLQVDAMAAALAEYIKRRDESDEPEWHCTQCGDSGTHFHACPGYPGESEF